MKIAMYLVAILTFASLTQAEIQNPEAYEACVKACKLPFRQYNYNYICVESGIPYETRCYYDCAKNDPGTKPSRLKEVECKPGGYYHCWNELCTERERVYHNVDPSMCLKEPPHDMIIWPCDEKCKWKAYHNRDVEYVPCNEVKTHYKDRKY